MFKFYSTKVQWEEGGEKVKNCRAMVNLLWMPFLVIGG